MALLNTAKSIAGKIMTNGIKVAPEIARQRLRICKACPHLFLQEQGKVIKKCGCFVSEKIKYQDPKCPVGKWW